MNACISRGGGAEGEFYNHMFCGSTIEAAGQVGAERYGGMRWRYSRRGVARGHATQLALLAFHVMVFSVGACEMVKL